MKRKDFVGSVCPAVVIAMMSAPLIYSCSREENSPVEIPLIKYNVLISAGEGGTVSTGGGEFTQGQIVNVTASPQGEYIFKEWSDGNTNATRTINVSSDITLTANFEKKKYPLTINIEGEGEVLEEIVNPGRTTDYDSGTTIKLTANPVNGWIFQDWKGAIESSEPITQVTLSEPLEITATFIIDDTVGENNEDPLSEEESRYHEVKELSQPNGYYYENKLLYIDLSNENYGSLEEISAFVNDLENGLLLLRKNTDTIMAFDNCCPHLGTRNQWAYSNNRFRCNNHGNSFGIGEGFTSFCSSNSTSGNLKQFPVKIYKDIILIDFS
jgi:nitrite reductase/ring-hydroxylating ferredoxin subunit